MFVAYNTLLAEGLDPILNPNSPTAHHIGQHHVRHKTVSDNNYLTWVCYPSLGVLLEIRHDFVFAARLLDAMSKH